MLTGKFKVRGLTRNANSDAAKTLAAQGVEVVEGNLSNKDDIRKAFKGAYGVFAVTNFWVKQQYQCFNDLFYRIKIILDKKFLKVKHW